MTLFKSLSIQDISENVRVHKYPKIGKIWIKRMKFLKFIFVTFKRLTDFHFILNKVCCRTFIYMKVFYVTHLAWKWLSPNQRKIEQNMKNYINIYFLFYVALVLLIDLHFILNKVCCRTIIYMKVYLYNTSCLKMAKSKSKKNRAKYEKLYKYIFSILCSFNVINSSSFYIK